jgi:uncharacterized coiled-coil DUF342 family protein
MSITIDELKSEKETLVKDFEALSSRIKQVDSELAQMKSNLNAVHGAVQQIDKLILQSESKNEMPKQKAEALNIATS